MEEGLKYLPSHFIKWFRNLLQAETAHFYLLHNIDADALAPVFQVQVSQAPPRRAAIKKRQGFLVLEKNEAPMIVEEVLRITEMNISTRQYSISGLVNCLLFFDRLGSIPDELKQDSILRICELVPAEDYPIVLNTLSSLYNEHFEFSQNLPNGSLSVKEWDHLFQTLDYLDAFDSSISLLRLVLNASPSETNFVRVIKNLSPDPRAGLFHYGVDLTRIREQDVMEQLREQPIEASFYASLIGHSYSSKVPFLTQQLTQYLVRENWDTIGKYFFRKIYSGNKIQAREDVVKLIEDDVAAFLISEVSNETSPKNVIARLNWPVDFIAFGGWANQCHQRRIEVTFSKTTTEHLASAFCTILTETRKDLDDFLSKQKIIYDSWPHDPFALNVQHAYAYLMFSVFLCEEDQWRKIMDAFRTLCYELKTLFYGSYSASHLGTQLSNHILSQLLSFPESPTIEVQNGNRLTELLSTFSELVGCQWIHFTEQDDLIWNYENHKASYADMNLLYVMKRLQETPGPYVILVRPFRDFVPKFSTITWPLGND